VSGLHIDNYQTYLAAVYQKIKENNKMRMWSLSCLMH